MPTDFGTITIENFRSFRKLKVDGIGGINLITGKNNSGKSSFLEAVRLLATDGQPSVFYSILRYREENEVRPEEGSPAMLPDDFGSFCSLFTGFPHLVNCTAPIVIQTTAQDGSDSQRVTAQIGWFVEKPDSEVGRRLLKVTEIEPDLFGESGGFPPFPALEIEGRDRRRIIRMDVKMDGRLRYRPFDEDPRDRSLPPCIYLDPFLSRSTGGLASRWDAVALTEEEQDVVRALQMVAPDIEALSMVGGEAGSRERVAKVRSRLCTHPVPLRSYGDGVNRLFGLMLSLVCAKSGVLLVDEIENGLHYSILPEVWAMVFSIAARLNVQVFATTHSWDCITAFQAAAADHPKAALLRLLAKDGDIVPAVFNKEELRIATRDQIELR